MNAPAEVPAPEALADADVVEALEEWLAAARKGELTGVLLVGRLRTPQFQHRWVGRLSLSEALGTVELAKHSLLRELDEEIRG